MIAEIINSINDLFKTLFNALSTSPKNFVIIVLIFFSVYSMFNNASLVDRVPVRNSTSMQMQRTIQLNEDIPAMLEATRNMIGSDRIVLRQFHNGTHSISGVPFLFVATTHATSDPGQGLSDIEAWQSYPLSTMINTVSDMTEEGPYQSNCVILPIEKVKDEFYSTYLARYDIKVELQCPITNGDGLMVGFIGVHFTKYNLSQLDEIRINQNMTVLKRAAENLSERLQDDVSKAENVSKWYNPLTWF